MRKKVTIVAGTFLIILFLCSIYIMLYAKFGIGFPCIFHEVTGQYCAGCGMTRAIMALKELDFYQAFRYNIFIFIAFPFLVIYCLLESYYWILNRKNRFENVFHTVAVVILVGVLAYGVLRNVPAFSWLAPTDII